eukprot:TRINITY_DN10173_c0_g1_i1.p1 TRINITY_DN10173_c0_g1~~TRINITY_DN10173_c0_g1_i1.p1  ORF type:complete len:564 (-),score=48.89 TRINITY_DN10173_c0_g1_i1:1269-2960(-)
MATNDQQKSLEELSTLIRKEIARVDTSGISVTVLKWLVRKYTPALKAKGMTLENFVTSSEFSKFWNCTDRDEVVWVYKKEPSEIPESTSGDVTVHTVPQQAAYKKQQANNDKPQWATTTLSDPHFSLNFINAQQLQFQDEHGEDDEIQPMIPTAVSHVVSNVLEEEDLLQHPSLQQIEDEARANAAAQQAHIITTAGEGGGSVSDTLRQLVQKDPGLLNRNYNTEPPPAELPLNTTTRKQPFDNVIPEIAPRIGHKILEHFWKGNLSKQLRQQREGVRSRVEQQVRRSAVPDARVFVFGSMRFGVANSSASDMDLVVLTAEQRGKEEDLAILKKVRQALIPFCGGWNNVQLIRAKVPIVTGISGSVEFDISLDSNGLANSQLLYRYTKTGLKHGSHPALILKALIMHSVSWGKQTECIKPKQGFLNSFTLTVMLLYFLLKEKEVEFIDPHEAVPPGSLWELPANPLHKDNSTRINLNKEDTQLCGKLFVRFVHFYATQFHSKELIQVDTEEPEANPQPSQIPLFVRDPFQPTKVLSKAINSDKWGVIRGTLRQTLQEMTAVKK